MERDLRILLVDPLKGRPVIKLFKADDGGASEKAFEEAAQDPGNECVRLFIYPEPMRIQFPSEDAGLMKRTAAENEARAERLANAQIEAARAAREQAEADLADAVAAHEALLPSKPEGEDAKKGEGKY